MIYLTERQGLPGLLSVSEVVPHLTEYPGTLMRRSMLEIGYPRPMGPGYTQYEALAGPAIRDIAWGADPAERLHQLASDLDKYLGMLSRFKQ